MSDDKRGQGSDALWPLVQAHRRVILYCLAICSAVLLYGFDLVVVGTVSAMPEFQKDFGEAFDGGHIIPSTWLALWSVSSPLGVITGAILCGPLQDKLGRRYSLALGSILSAMAVAICFVSDIPTDENARRGTFLAGKALQGVSLGIALTTTQTYMSEVVPPAIRGPVLSFIPLFTLLGQLVGAIVVYVCLDVRGRNSYRIPFATQWPFSVAPLLAAFVLPESPVWLVRRHRIDEAATQQQRLDGLDASASREAVETLEVAIIAERQNKEAASYKQCFRGIDLRRTMIVAYANCMTQLFGLTLLANASYFLQILGMAEGLSVIFLIIGIVLGLLANGGSVWTLNRFGRRPLTHVSFSLSTVFWLAIGIAGCFEGDAVIWFIAVSAMLVVFICGLMVWPASYAISSEASSLHLRAITQGIGWAVGSVASGVFAIVLPYVYNADAGDLRGKTGFLFAGTCLVGLVLSWLYVPEMKGRTAHEIDTMFALRLPARSFESWRGDDDDVLDMKIMNDHETTSAVAVEARPLAAPTTTPPSTDQPSESEGWITMDDGLKVYSKTWTLATQSMPRAHIVLMHGFSDHVNLYSRFANQLTTNFPILVSGFDRRGWGRTVASPSQQGAMGTTSRLLSDIDAVLSHYQSAHPNLPLIVLAHSMGGLDLLTYALQTPSTDQPLAARDKLTGIVLDGPYVALVKPPSTALVRMGRLAGRVMPNHRFRMKPDTRGLCRDPAVVDAFLADDLCHNRGTLRGFAGVLERADWLTRMSHGEQVQDMGTALPCAVLWAHGTEDGATSFGASRRLYETLAGGGRGMEGDRFVAYEGWYHQLHAEPDGGFEQYAEDVGNWVLERVGDSSAH